MAPVSPRVRFASILIVLLRMIRRALALLNFTSVLFAYLKYLGSNCLLPGFTLTCVKLWYPVKAQELVVPLLPFIIIFLINVRRTVGVRAVLQSAGVPALDSVS